MPTFRHEHGRAPVRSVLLALLEGCTRSVRADEESYLPLIHSMIESGTLSERIAARLRPYAADPAALRAQGTIVYGELADSLVRNEPWHGRGWPEAGRRPRTGEEVTAAFQGRGSERTGT